jgi:elongation factor Ts
MEISAQMVKELRDKTGAGIMDCKAALAEAQGDFEEAQIILRKRGVAVAEKKAARSANDGLIVSHLADGGRIGVLVEVNCETDFVAKNPEFQQLAQQVARLVAEAAPGRLKPEDPGAGAALLELKLEDGTTLANAVQAKIAKFGENMTVRRFQRIEGGVDGHLGAYVHAGGKIGVLVVLRGAAGSPVATALARDLALHVCAASPRWVAAADIPPAVLEREREIAHDQMAGSGKPAAVIEKIVEGKLKKFYAEACLMDQTYIRDDTKTVAALLAETAAKAGGPLRVERFVRYQLGGESPQSPSA